VPFETSHTAVESRLLDRALPPRAVVLDAGCGRTTRLAARRDRIRALVGIDLDVEAGHENTALDRFLRADLCEPLPVADATFDVVYANFVVEHLADPDQAFAEWRRALRPEGSLVLLTSNTASPPLQLARLLPASLRLSLKRHGAGAAERDVFPAVYRANTPGVLVAALSRAGFRPVAVETVATLDRYAGRHRLLAAMLRAFERLMPAGRRSTIVGLWMAEGAALAADVNEHRGASAAVS
jgi:SAM-dependent methyltransferase